MKRCFRLTAALLVWVILIVGIAQSVYSEQRESNLNTDSKYAASLSKNEIAALKSRENQNPQLLDTSSGEGDPIVKVIELLAAVLAVIGLVALTGKNVESLGKF